MSVGIVIGTFGTQEWKLSGEELERKVRDSQSPMPHADHIRVLSVHGDTLAEARNVGAKALATDWLIFLDADDDLRPGYVSEMLRTVKSETLDIVQPATIGVYPDGSTDPEANLIPKRDLATGNYIVIGAMCRRSKFDEVGGFRELPVLEDWDLWRRMWKAGAKIGSCETAIYVVGVNPGSRNSDTPLHNRVYRQIRNGQ